MSQRSTGSPTDDAQPTLDPDRYTGRSVAGHRLGARIGDGPTGVVHRLVDGGGAGHVIKIIHRELGGAEMLATLRAELSRLDGAGETLLHTVVESGLTDDGCVFLISDELAGSDLAAALTDGAATRARSGNRVPVSASRAMDVVRRACLAVESAHAVGVVHGGLKPRNLYLSPDGALHVLDVALPRRRATKVNSSSVIFGDPRYLAPEQLADGVAADIAGDVYALGAILHELIRGEAPRTTSDGAGWGVASAIASASATGGTADQAMSRLLERALAADPKDRFSSVSELRAAIEECANESRRMGEWAAMWVAVQPSAPRAATAANAGGGHISSDPHGGNVSYEMASHKRPHTGGGGKSGHGHGGSGGGPRPPEPRTPPAAPKPAPPPPTSTARPPEQARPAPTAPPPQQQQHNGHADSVEASLEDFISQANKSFREPAAGWSLNTDEVELVDESDVKSGAKKGHDAGRPGSAQVVAKPAQNMANAGNAGARETVRLTSTGAASHAPEARPEPKKTVEISSKASARAETPVAEYVKAAAAAPVEPAQKPGSATATAKQGTMLGLGNAKGGDQNRGSNKGQAQPKGGGPQRAESAPASSSAAQKSAPQAATMMNMEAPSLPFSEPAATPPAERTQVTKNPFNEGQGSGPLPSETARVVPEGRPAAEVTQETEIEEIEPAPKAAAPVEKSRKEKDGKASAKHPAAEVTALTPTPEAAAAPARQAQSSKAAAVAIAPVPVAAAPAAAARSAASAPSPTVKFPTQGAHSAAAPVAAAGSGLLPGGVIGFFLGATLMFLLMHFGMSPPEVVSAPPTSPPVYSRPTPPPPPTVTPIYAQPAPAEAVPVSRAPEPEPEAAPPSHGEPSQHSSKSSSSSSSHARPAAKSEPESKSAKSHPAKSEPAPKAHAAKSEPESKPAHSKPAKADNDDAPPPKAKAAAKPAKKKDDWVDPFAQ